MQRETYVNTTVITKSQTTEAATTTETTETVISMTSEITTSQEITTSIIEETSSLETEKVDELKSIEEIAKEVLNGKWGNGDVRKNNLIAAGYDYEEVQSKVKELKDEIAIVSSENENINQTYVGEFQGTWYHTNGRASNGGSGRQLIQCNTTDLIKGSIASATLYNRYGYKYSGGRTKVYLEFSNYSSMNGYYYLDDCCRDSWVIDFYYYGRDNNCPFKNAGRIYGIKCWVVN